MPDTQTANYALTKPEVGGSDNTWGAKFNANLDAIDAAIKAVVDASVAKSGDTMTGTLNTTGLVTAGTSLLGATIDLRRASISVGRLYVSADSSYVQLQKRTAADSSLASAFTLYDDDIIMSGSGLGATLPNSTSVVNRLRGDTRYARLEGGNTLEGNITFNGRQFIADGTVALPSLAFSADGDVGLHRIGSNQLAVVGSGAVRARFDAPGSGNPAYDESVVTREKGDYRYELKVTSYGDKIADVSHTAVGAHAQMENLSGLTLSPGSTVAGSSLRWCSANGSTNSASTPAGTWRCLGMATSSNRVSLFQRVA